MRPFRESSELKFSVTIDAGANPKPMFLALVYVFPEACFLLRREWSYRPIYASAAFFLVGHTSCFASPQLGPTFPSQTTGISNSTACSMACL